MCGRLLLLLVLTKPIYILADLDEYLSSKDDKACKIESKDEKSEDDTDDDNVLFPPVRFNKSRCSFSCILLRMHARYLAMRLLIILYLSLEKCDEVITIEDEDVKPRPTLFEDSSVIETTSGYT